MTYSFFKLSRCHLYPLVIIVLSLLSLSISVNAQSKDGLKHLSKGKLDDAFSAFQTDLGDKNYDMLAKFNLAKVYFHPDFSGKNIDSAYHYIKTVIESSRKLDYNLRKKITKMDPSFNGMNKVRRDIVKAAYEKTAEAATLEDYNHFLTFYEKGDRTLESKIAKKRNTLAFKYAKGEDTFGAYDELLKEYGSNMAKKNPDLYKKAQLRHFETYIVENGWNAYDTYADKYKKNIYVRDSFKMDFDRVRRANNLKSYKGFTLEYPTSTYTNIAADSLASFALRGGTITDYEYFISTFPEHDRADEIWMKFYELYVRLNGKESIKQFKYTYEKFPHKDRLERELIMHEAKTEDEAIAKAKESNNFWDYHDFIQMYQMSSRLPEAIEGIYSVIKESGNLYEYEYFVTSFPKHAKADTMWMNFYELYKKEHGKKSIYRFERQFPEFPFKEILAADKKAIPKPKPKVIIENK